MTNLTIRTYVCKKCGHEVALHTDMEAAKPGACSVCGNELQEKRNTV